MAQSNPQVTVVVTHHINENDKYLELCLKALQASEGVEIEVFAVSDAPIRPAIEGVHWDVSLDNVPKKWEYALKHSNPSAKYFLMVSDDVVVSKHMIQGMFEVLSSNPDMILGPMSNCDATTRYFTSHAVQNEKGEVKVLPIKCTLEEIAGWEDSIINFNRGPTILIDPVWISFYCVMMPKSVLEKVGKLDERLEVRHNDVDYCHRARQLGIPSLIHLGVFALHFGDRTLPKVTTAEEYSAADRAFRDKYSQHSEVANAL